MKRVVRLKAVIPLTLLVALIGWVWYALLDNVVRRSIETVGTNLVGARVDLARADIRLREGSITLQGLQVTNPDSPMTNLVQVDEIVADMRFAPLLQKKVFVDTAALRGVRFNTPRATSGAIERPSQESGATRRRIAQWAERVPIPEFSLEGLTGTVDVDAIRPESLQTPRLALAIRDAADSTRQAWEQQVQALNPQPLIDSADALVQRLAGASLFSLGIQGVRRSVVSVRSTVDGVNTVRDGITQLRQSVTSEADAMRARVAALDEARRRDITSARNLLQIPSLSAPDISPALFGQLALDRIQPVLYWAQMAERYVPPGLDPRRRPGPKRARLAGTNVEFPKARGYAGLTVGFAELDVELGGTGAAAGQYRVQVSDFTSSPSVHGRPMRLLASRTDAASGPDAVSLAVVLDHVTSDILDSIQARIVGVSLPSITLPGLGTQMNLGTGTSEFALVRTGDSVIGRLQWQAPRVSWDRGALGRGRVNDVVWRTLSGLRRVDVEIRVGGSVLGPRLAVRTNIASEISRSLRRELRNEVQAAEARVRAEVERLVAQPIADARGRIGTVEREVQGVLDGYQQQLDQARADLEARLGELRRLLPIGN